MRIILGLMFPIALLAISFSLVWFGILPFRILREYPIWVWTLGLSTGLVLGIMHSRWMKSRNDEFADRLAALDES